MCLAVPAFPVELSLPCHEAPTLSHACEGQGLLHAFNARAVPLKGRTAQLKTHTAIMAVASVMACSGVFAIWKNKACSQGPSLFPHPAVLSRPPNASPRPTGAPPEQ